MDPWIRLSLVCLDRLDGWLLYLMKEGNESIRFLPSPEGCEPEMGTHRMAKSSGFSAVDQMPVPPTGCGAPVRFPNLHRGPFYEVLGIFNYIQRTKTKLRNLT